MWKEDFQGLNDIQSAILILYSRVHSDSITGYLQVDTLRFQDVTVLFVYITLNCASRETQTPGLKQKQSTAKYISKNKRKKKE